MPAPGPKDGHASRASRDLKLTRGASAKSNGFKYGGGGRDLDHGGGQGAGGVRTGISNSLRDQRSRKALQRKFFERKRKREEEEEDKADFLSVVDEVKADGSKTYKYVPYSELPHGMLIDKLANGFNIRVANVEVIKKLNIEFFTISKLSQVEASTHDGDIISRPTLTEMGLYTNPVIEGGKNFPF